MESKLSLPTVVDSSRLALGRRRAKGTLDLECKDIGGYGTSAGFNRLLRASVSRRLGYFRRGRSLRRRCRSVSDAGLCDLANNETDMDYLTIQDAKQRRSLAVSTYGTIPGLCITCGRGPHRLGSGWNMPPRLYDQSDTADNTQIVVGIGTKILLSF
ncbi:hypothetical protein EVAR_46897_1 [Eumeta japonica]|uniref:Uncharacterized protein n=1 Tax=Eumeta variegata TaxID=151549 RepID=A0A4C1YH46_EUMVA|nr:hypothetical protein EVAR_46897_1 [Eumeta japonica]